jgi:hypothetical protein
MNPGADDTLIPGLPSAWTRDDTMHALNRVGLPATFTYTHRDGGERPVMPSHSKLKGGFGKWLRETPYFRGLFDECHCVFARLPDDETITADRLAALLIERRKARGTQLGLL